MQIGSYKIRPFVVTLQELPEKEKFIMAHFRERGIEAETFNGISAAVSGLRTIYPYEVDAPGSGWNMGDKPVATWLSFWALWSAWQYMPDDFFLQMEWDTQFPINWRERTEAALRDVPPDFDMLFLGSCCASDKPKRHISGEVFECKHALCGHATVIARKALPTILRTQRKVYAPLDLSLFFHTLPLLRVFVVLPRICDQFNTTLPP